MPAISDMCNNSFLNYRFCELDENITYTLTSYFCRDVNNDIMELLVMSYACKTSSARNIIGVIPYLPYCKQSKMRKRGAIVSKLLAKMMCKAGMCINQSNLLGLLIQKISLCCRKNVATMY